MYVPIVEICLDTVSVLNSNSKSQRQRLHHGKQGIPLPQFSLPPAPIDTVNPKTFPGPNWTKSQSICQSPDPFLTCEKDLKILEFFNLLPRWKSSAIPKFSEWVIHPC